MKHLVYATTNPGKLGEVTPYLATHSIDVQTMRDLGCADLDVPEPGTTLGENALLKVTAYAGEIIKNATLRGNTIVLLSDDTGLEIDGLGGEPGIHVRRWRDGVTRMEDQEIIDYALLRMKDLRGTTRGAQFRTVLAVRVVNEDGLLSAPAVFVGTLRGSILEQPDSYRTEGFPFESLFFVDDWQMVLGAAHRLPEEEKAKFLSHRERAISAAVPFLQAQLS